MNGMKMYVLLFLKVFSPLPRRTRLKSIKTNKLFHFFIVGGERATLLLYSRD